MWFLMIPLVLGQQPVLGEQRGGGASASREVPTEIVGLEDLGLPEDWKGRFRTTPEIAVLVNPRWRSPEGSRRFLSEPPFLLPGESASMARRADRAGRAAGGQGAGSIVGFDEGQIAALVGEKGYEESLIWRKVRDVADQLAYAIFSRQASRHGSLAELVTRSTSNRIPLLVLDPYFRLRRSGENLWMDVHLTVRLFYLAIESVEVSDTIRARKLVRCELLFEDRGLGSVPMDDGEKALPIHTAVQASLIDALKGKVALSLIRNGLLEGNLLDRRPNCIGQSLSANPRPSGGGGVQ